MAICATCGEKYSGVRCRICHTGDEEPDRQCVFQHQGRRCPFPNTISVCIQTRDRDKYCLHHSQPGNRDHGPEQDRFFADHSEPSAVRRRMAEWYGPPYHGDELVDSMLEAHPEFFRGDSEPRSEWLARLKRYRKGKQAIRRMP